MARDPFKPVGERARWRVIYDLLKNLDVGEVLTYAEMGEALDLHPDDDRITIQLAMRRATQELEQADKHTTDVVTGVGYRIAEPIEHLGLARKHQRKANRALVRGKDKATYVDLTGLPEEQKRAFEVVAAAFAAQLDFNKRFDVRQRNLEKAFNSVATRQEETETEVEELRERLARLEGRLGRPS